VTTADAPSSARTWAVRGAILASIALSGTAIVGAVLARLEAMSAPVPSVHGLRLGVTPEDVRQRRAGEGWTTQVSASGDLVLERPGEVYEFHEGMLVAATVEVDQSDPGPAREITPTSVLVRDRTGSRTRLRLVSRGCPTHAEEAARLVAGP
jgi:hypothetical protein